MKIFIYSYIGYRKIYKLMRDSWSIRREQVRLIRRREGLQVVKKRRKRKLLGMTTQWVPGLNILTTSGATILSTTRRRTAVS